MKFNYNGVCSRCGCGTYGEGESKFQSNYSSCYGCGSIEWVTPIKDENNNIIFDESNNSKPKMKTVKLKGYGACLTKDYNFINFLEKPSPERIEELKQNAIYLILWNEKQEWLDTVVGTPLMRKDVILLEQEDKIKKYLTEPNVSVILENNSKIQPISI